MLFIHENKFYASSFPKNNNRSFHVRKITNTCSELSLLLQDFSTEIHRNRKADEAFIHKITLVEPMENATKHEAEQRKIL